MVCLGLEPGVAEWKAQTNPLSYVGSASKKKFCRIILPCRCLFNSLLPTQDRPFCPHFCTKRKNFFFLSLPQTFFHFDRLLFCSVTRLGDFKRILETNFLTKSGPNTYLGTFWGILKNVTFEVKNALATFG